MRLVDKRFGGVVEIRQGDVLSDDSSFLGPDAIGSKAGAAGAGQLWQAFLHALDPLISEHDRGQVWLWEVAVFVGFLLAAQGEGHALGVVPGAGFEANLFAVLEKLCLALDLILDGALHGAEAVEVFDLGAGTEFLLADWAQGDVDIAAQRAFLHLGVADAGVDDDGAQLFEISAGVGGAAHVRLADDLDQRHAGAVVVCQ